jgi:hypothetical protein
MAELAAGGGLEPDEQAAVAQLVSLAWTDRQDKLLLRDARQAAVQDDVRPTLCLCVYRESHPQHYICPLSGWQLGGGH